MVPSLISSMNFYLYSRVKSFNEKVRVPST
jgi:hypothetical protein